MNLIPCMQLLLFPALSLLFCEDSHFYLNTSRLRQFILETVIALRKVNTNGLHTIIEG